LLAGAGVFGANSNYRHDAGQQTEKKRRACEAYATQNIFALFCLEETSASTAANPFFIPSSPLKFFL
jgi:hypothetical protein